MKNRVVIFDISRALCTIWIVSFWHLNQYLDTDIKFYVSGSEQQVFYRGITDGILALFTFLSGFFLSQKTIANKKDVLDFYRKRLLRFLIPLFLSCIILACVGYLSPLQIVTTCLGISQFLPLPYPKTLWYFSMIICFYYLTPFILWTKSKKTIYNLIACILLMSFFLLGHKYLGFDRRLAENFLFYSIPFATRDTRIYLKVFQYRLHYLFTLAGIAVIIFYPFNGTFVEQSIESFIICFLVLSLSSFFEIIPKVPYIFGILSFSSMFAYLYHREIYISATKIIGTFDVWEALFCIVTLFIASYYGQKIYDKFTVKFIKKT